MHLFASFWRSRHLQRVMSRRDVLPRSTRSWLCVTNSSRLLVFKLSSFVNGGKMLRMTLIFAMITAAGFACLSAAAQSSDSPQVEHARVEKKALAGPLAAEVKAWATRAEEPQWLGYAVPQMGRERAMCCGDYQGSWRNGCGHCRLEDRDSGTNMTSRGEAGTTKLEGPRAIAVLFRAENKHVTKIRVVSLECSLDAGGLPFVWLSGVKAAESVELLKTFVQGTDLEAHDDHHTSHGALTSIALHADPAADQALESFT